MAGMMVQNMQPTQRRLRRPKHTWNIKKRPWMITPFLIAPVLPGETLKSFTAQARTVTDPLAAKLVGWWNEHYWFYVRHTDLDGADDYKEMHLDLSKDMSSYNAAAHLGYYEVARGIGWVGPILKRVVETYFRDEGEAWNVATMTADFLGGSSTLPLAQIGNEGVLNSVQDTTTLATGGTLPDEDASATYEDLRKGMEAYQYLLTNGMINMSYEDYLATFGVKLQREEENQPELLRYVREWTYPSNTIEPTTGVPTSACSWSMQARADKDRFFKEPGFIFGVTVSRPKVYLSRQTAHASSMLDGLFEWLPALMHDTPSTSLKEFANSAGPFTNPTNGYWLDLRDLFIYGDQFVNHALSDTDYSAVALPTVGLEQRYASATDAGALFVDTDGPLYAIREDGVCDFSILGTQLDMTPVGNPAARG